LLAILSVTKKLLKTTKPAFIQVILILELDMGLCSFKIRMSLFTSKDKFLNIELLSYIGLIGNIKAVMLLCSIFLCSIIGI